MRRGPFYYPINGVIREIHAWESRAEAKKAIGDTMSSLLKELGEFEGLSQLVSVFADKMRARLWEKMAEGYTGWADREDNELFLESMRERLSIGVTEYLGGNRLKIIDVANIAAIIWLHESADERAIPYTK